MAAVQPDCVSADILQVLGNRGSVVVLSAMFWFASRGAKDINKIIFHRIVSYVIEDLNAKKKFFVPSANFCKSFSWRCVNI